MNAEELRLIATVSVRRLWPMRHLPDVGADARDALRAWLRTLRAMRPH